VEFCVDAKPNILEPPTLQGAFIKKKTLQGVSQSEMPRPVHSRPGASSCHVAAAWAGNAAASAESSTPPS